MRLSSIKNFRKVNSRWFISKVLMNEYGLDKLRIVEEDFKVKESDLKDDEFVA